MAKESISDNDLIRLRNQIIMSEKLNETALEPQMLEAVERYTGKFVPAMAIDWDVLLNEIYPIIQYNLPAIFFRNPRVFLKPRQKTFIAKRRNPISGAMEEIQLDSTKSAQTQEAILNYVLSEIRYKQEVRKVLLDALLFRHGILWHGYKGEFGMTEEQSMYVKDEMVFVKRLSPMKFLKDPSVIMSNLDEANWIARSFDVPVQDLLEDDTLDVDKKSLKGIVGYGDKIGLQSFGKQSAVGGGDIVNIGSALKPLIDYTDSDFRNSSMARFVTLYEVFMRPSKKEKRDGSNGKVVLLSKEQSKPLRVNPWPYKAEGWPSIILEFNGLNDSMFGLADIETYSGIADQKNTVVNLQLRNAQENSKVWVGISKEGANEEDIDRIKVGDQTIIAFEGNPNDKLFVKSAGAGASQELYILDTRIDKNLQDKSGVTDLKKGFLQSGEESAASVQLRAAGGSARPAYRQDMMADFLKDSCHFLNQLTKQFFPVDKAVRIVGSLDIEWSNNFSKEEIQAETDVEIDVISMLPENPEKEVQELNTVLALMVQSLQNPAIFSKIEQEGYKFNMYPIIQNILMRLKIKNPDVFRKIRPEESEGYVPVRDLRDAKSNVDSALAGSPQVPVPPAPGQNHSAHIETYDSILNLIQDMGDTQALRTLQQLVQLHQALLEEEQNKESRPGRAIPPIPSIGQQIQGVGV